MSEERNSETISITHVVEISCNGRMALQMVDSRSHLDHSTRACKANGRAADAEIISALSNIWVSISGAVNFCMYTEDALA